jgi:ABC-type polysaccharide/polyol phosphate transport system ATPase subunit
MTPAIRIENLSKVYRIGARLPGGYRTLRDTLVDAATTPWRQLRSWAARPPAGAGDAPDTHWALRDVSLEVPPGEVVGIVGHNGAGKSTLLKVLSRITEPTSGRVELRGRVASLLEVGTGLHPELTGRENVYLNGAVLGMTRREIDRKFAAIVDFSEVDKFLDTPVKFYSSGMYMRLAFSVAAHLEPEILVVDEVLAVGDAAFQEKCLGKVGEVARGGRTVLFVSHNMQAVQRLCRKALLLERGRVAGWGATAEIVSRYLASGLGRLAPADWRDLTAAPWKAGDGTARFLGLAYTSDAEGAAFRPYPDGPVEFTLAIATDAPRTVDRIAVILFDRSGTKLINADTFSLGQACALRAGRNEVRLRIEQLHLKPGVYLVGLWMAQHPDTVFDHLDGAAEIEVVEYPPERVRARPMRDGVVTCPFTFRGPA